MILFGMVVVVVLATLIQLAALVQTLFLAVAVVALGIKLEAHLSRVGLAVILPVERQQLLRAEALAVLT
jgi:hypothetical protein